jgi:hypothetical protein
MLRVDMDDPSCLSPAGVSHQNPFPARTFTGPIVPVEAQGIQKYIGTLHRLENRLLVPCSDTLRFPGGGEVVE